MEESLDGLQPDEPAPEQKIIKVARYDEWRSRKLEKPEIRAALEELQPAYVVARLRIQTGKSRDIAADEVEALPDPEVL